MGHNPIFLYTFFLQYKSYWHTVVKEKLEVSEICLRSVEIGCTHFKLDLNSNSMAFYCNAMTLDASDVVLHPLTSHNRDFTPLDQGGRRRHCPKS